jgi:hypothetical protein
VKGKIKKFSGPVKNSDTCVITEMEGEGGRSVLLTNESSRLLCLTYGSIFVSDGYRSGNIKVGFLTPDVAKRYGLGSMYYVVLYTTDVGETHIYNYNVKKFLGVCQRAKQLQSDFGKEYKDGDYFKQVVQMIKSEKTEGVSAEVSKDLVAEYRNSVLERLIKLGYTSKDVRFKSDEVHSANFADNLDALLTQCLDLINDKKVSDVRKAIRHVTMKETNRDAKMRMISMPVSLGNIIKQSKPSREKAILKDQKIRSALIALGIDPDKLLTGFMISSKVKANILNLINLFSRGLRAMKREEALHLSTLLKILTAIVSDMVEVEVGEHDNDLKLIELSNSLLNFKLSLSVENDFDEIMMPSDAKDLYKD